MKALNKVTAMLAALVLTSGTALAAPAVPAQNAPLVSEGKVTISNKSNICIGAIFSSPEIVIIEVTCYFYSDGTV